MRKKPLTSMQWFNLRCRQRKPVSLPLYEEYLKEFESQTKETLTVVEEPNDKVPTTVLRIRKL